MLKCGASKREINPDLPVNLVGYGPDIVATGVHDDIEVNCLYLESGTERLAVMAYDSETIDAEFIAEMQAAVSKATGLAERAVLATASHSHSTPLMRRRRARGTTENVAEAWLQRVIERSVEAATEAVERSVEADVYCSSSQVDENYNRRTFLDDGTFYYQPRHKELLALADGPADKELGALYFRRAGAKQAVATVVNYTAHALTVGDTAPLVSADYPGALRREIEGSLGGVALFVNGACGDNHPLGAEAGFGRCERMGAILAEAALFRRFDAVEMASPGIASDYREILMPAMTREIFETLPNNMKSEFKPVRDDLLVGGDVRTYFSLWAIGPVLFVGVPGEMTAELGLYLKWQSPFPRTYIMYMATDHIGYIPHGNAYEWGGYEALTSPFAPRAGEILCAAILDAAREMKAKLESMGGVTRLPGSEPS